MGVGGGVSAECMLALSRTRGSRGRMCALCKLLHGRDCLEIGGECICQAHSCAVKSVWEQEKRVVDFFKTITTMQNFWKQYAVLNFCV